MPVDTRLFKDLRVCIGCGTDNPQGLRLQFAWEGEELVSRWVPRPEHQGWAGFVHGGILCLVLDEIMAQMVYRVGHLTPTAELTVRFKKPVPIGETVILSASKPEGRRILHAKAQIHNEDGELLAEGMAKFLPAPREDDAR